MDTNTRRGLGRILLILGKLSHSSWYEIWVRSDSQGLNEGERRNYKRLIVYEKSAKYIFDEI